MRRRGRSGSWTGRVRCGTDPSSSAEDGRDMGKRRAAAAVGQSDWKVRPPRAVRGRSEGMADQGGGDAADVSGGGGGGGRGGRVGEGGRRRRGLVHRGGPGGPGGEEAGVAVLSDESEEARGGQEGRGRRAPDRGPAGPAAEESGRCRDHAVYFRSALGCSPPVLGSPPSPDLGMPRCCRLQDMGYGVLIAWNGASRARGCSSPILLLGAGEDGCEMRVLVVVCIWYQTPQPPALPPPPPSPIRAPAHPPGDRSLHPRAEQPQPPHTRE